MSTAPATLVALQGSLPARLAAGDPDVVRILAQQAGKLKAALLFGADSHPLQIDSAALATALSVRLPGWPVIAGSDGHGDHPYNTSRRFLSVDHLSGGRTGVVFRGGGAAAEHTAERIGVVRALWNSWPRESLLADRATGVYARTGGIRAIEHRGPGYSVKGALNSPSSAQSEPVSLWHVSTAAELDAAHGLVDLVIIDDPGLASRWESAPGYGRPGLVAAGGVADHSQATAELVSAASTGDLAAALEASTTAAASTARTLREVLGLARRSYDLSSKPPVFGVHRA